MNGINNDSMNAREFFESDQQWGKLFSDDQVEFDKKDMIEFAKSYHAHKISSDVDSFIGRLSLPDSDRIKEYDSFNPIDLKDPMDEFVFFSLPPRYEEYERSIFLENLQKLIDWIKGN